MKLKRDELYIIIENNKNILQADEIIVTTQQIITTIAAEYNHNLHTVSLNQMFPYTTNSLILTSTMSLSPKLRYPCVFNCPYI